jgi:hypothetical protein
MQGGGDEGVVVADGLGRLTGRLHRPVEVVEVLGREPTQADGPESGPDRPLDLGPVGAQRRGREIEAGALVERPVDERADGDPETVYPARALTVDQVPEGGVSPLALPWKVLDTCRGLPVTGSRPM